LASSTDDALGTAGVTFEKGGAIVDLAVDDEPRIILGSVVLLELIERDDLVDPVLCHLDLFCVLNSGMLRLFSVNLLAPVAI
jgi:hypothetical protein